MAMDINYAELYQQYKLNEWHEKAKAEAEWNAKYGEVWREHLKYIYGD